MKYTGNNMIDGDDGRHPFSPKHKPSQFTFTGEFQDCEFCNSRRGTEECKMLPTSRETICIYCLDGELSLSIKDLLKHYKKQGIYYDDLREVIFNTVKDIHGLMPAWKRYKGGPQS